MTTTEKLLLTPEEAAYALGVGRSTLFELMNTHELHSVRSDAADESRRPRSPSTSLGFKPSD